MGKKSKGGPSNKKKGRKEHTGERDKQKCTGTHRKQTKSANARRCTSLEAELSAVGLRVKEVTPDGNCFFRAVADQMGRGQNGHLEIREIVMKHIENNRDGYAAFVEDDEDFDSYVERMKRDATWAGHLEVQAASCCLGRNIVIYQRGQPAWRVINHTPVDQHQTMHLSYHDGEHYNSVRCMDDSDSGDPAMICPSLLAESARVDQQGTFGVEEVEEVAKSSSTVDLDQVRIALKHSHGNVGGAVQLLAATLNSDADQVGEGDGAGGDIEDLDNGIDASQSRGTKDFALQFERESAKCSIELDGQKGNPEGRHGKYNAASLMVEHDVGHYGALAASGRDDDDTLCVRGRERPYNISIAEAAEASCKSFKSGQRHGIAVSAGDSKPIRGPGKNKKFPCGSGKKYKICCQPVLAAKGSATKHDKGNHGIPSLPAQLESLDI